MLERRQKEATDGEKEKYKAVLNVSYMSEDDDMTDEEGWRHLKLTWRADDVTKFFRELDQRSKTNKKEHLPERTKRTASGVSTLRPPKNAPAWSIKPKSPDTVTETPMPRNAERGRGLRLRGGRKSNDSTSSRQRKNQPSSHNPRREIIFSRDDILSDVVQ